MREIDPLVVEYQHDKHRPRESEALLILQKIASLVKPIMRQRDWKIGTLSEFYPSQKNLLGLNINAGQKICLRLRYPSDERQFLPLEQVVDTMLHELCHIVHGPHNREFHALWNQLRDEHEKLVMKGYTGEGFLSNGRRLGGRKLPVDEARRLARVAAEQRRTLTAGSGQKLGGAPLLRGTDVRKVIADAAQRRMDITKGCASGSSESEELAEEASRNGFKTKAEEDDANERAIMQAYMEMIQEEEREKYGSSYVPPSQENPAGSRSSPPPVPEHTKPKPSAVPPRPPARSSSNNNNVYADTLQNNTSYNQAWTCQICTLENPLNFLCCDACGSERTAPPSATSAPQSRLLSESRSSSDSRSTSKPRSRLASDVSEGSRAFKPRTRAVESLAALERKTPKRPLGWICHTCGTFMETEWWTCAACGTMKAVS